MDLAFIIAAAFVGGIIVGVAVEHFFFRTSNTEDDPTGEKKQQIFNTLTKLKSDIESTVN